MPVPIQQVGLALAWYLGLLVVMRLAGKRLAGQTTSFDLVVLITLGVVLQQATLLEGTTNALLFVLTVFAAHRAVSYVCTRSARFRRIVRGAPRPLIRNGQVAYEALEDEGLTYEELLAGLRKVGHPDPAVIRLATLEETGHISAIPALAASQSEPMSQRAPASDAAQRSDGSGDRAQGAPPLHDRRRAGDPEDTPRQTFSLHGPERSGDPPRR